MSFENQAAREFQTKRIPLPKNCCVGNSLVSAKNKICISKHYFATSVDVPKKLIFLLMTEGKRNGNIQHRLFRHRETDRDGDIHCCQEQEDQQELVYVRRRHKLQPPPSLQLFSALRLLLLQPPFPLSSNLDSSLLFYLPLLQITTQVAINVVSETKAEKQKKKEMIMMMMMMLRYETKTGDLGLCLCLCCMQVRKMAGEGDKSLPNACKKWSASVAFFYCCLPSARPSSLIIILRIIVTLFMKKE